MVALVLIGLYFLLPTAAASKAESPSPTELLPESSRIEPEKPKTPRELVEAEFSDVPVMIKISRCESQFRQYSEDGTVLRGKVNPLDVGLFQINEKYHLADSKKLGYDIHTPEGNIKYARYLYSKNGTRDWNWSSGCWR